MGRAAPLTALGLLLVAVWAQAADPPDYPQTRTALQERYADEIRAHQTYGAYAARALDEGYPNTAHLFRALAGSEAIHARNFARLLEQLGEQPVAGPYTPVLTGTQDHLEQATGVEADEIDVRYPAVIARLQAEGHAEAIEQTTWAWQAEKQHRELIVKIRDAAGTWFSLLMGRLEGERRHYHVCQVCGSTLEAVPAAACPICGHPASEYREVPWLPGKARAKDEDAGW